MYIYIYIYLYIYIFTILRKHAHECWPPQTSLNSFEPQNDFQLNKKTPDAATLTLHALNYLKQAPKIQIYCHNYNFKKIHTCVALCGPQHAECCLFLEIHYILILYILMLYTIYRHRYSIYIP